MNRVRLKLVNANTFFDMFGDEDISYTKKTISFQKPDQVWNDYSQSFNLPATANNNALFGYYFTLNAPTGFNPYAKNPAELWVGNERFSFGALQLLNGTKRNNKADNYNVQFFADVVDLKEALNDLTIDKLGWQDKNHSITVPLITNYLQGTPILNMRYPLASAENLWRWANSTEANTRNINATPAGDGILNREVRPAILVSEVMDRIFANAGYDYEVLFDNETYYSNLYMWANNAKKIGTDPPISRVAFDTTTVLAPIPQEVLTLRCPRELKDEFNMYNPTTGVFTMPNNTSFELSLLFESFGDLSYAVVVNGVPSAYAPLPSTVTIPLGALSQGDTVSVNIRNNAPAVGDSLYDPLLNLSRVTFAACELTASSGSALDTMDVARVMPKMACDQFIRGILNTFNAIIYWDNAQQKFIIQKREEWLDAGATFDISKYVDNSNEILQPPTGYKEFAFKFADGKDYQSILFTANNSKDYGEEIAKTGNYFGDQYVNNNPFTPTIWQEVVEVDAYGEAITETRICAFQSVSSDGKAVESGVRLMYYGGIATALGQIVVADFQGNKGGSFAQYGLFRNFDSASSTNLTYSEEFSYHNPRVTTVPTAPVLRADTLYNNFYRDYINSIYDPTKRRLSVKAKLPFGITKLLRPNDKVVINNVTYMIEELTVKLISGDVSLKLITNG